MTQIAFDPPDAETLRPPPLSDAPPVESGRRRVLAPPPVRADVHRMGMYVAVASDGVFFASVFGVALTVRSTHPELFAYGRYYLNRALGLTETSVVLAGMLATTLAAALAHRGATVALRGALSLAVVLGGAFLVLGAFESSEMVGHGLLPGRGFSSAESVWETPAFRAEHADATRYAETFRVARVPTRPMHGRRTGLVSTRRSAIEATTSLVGVGALGAHAVFPDLPSEPRNAHLFFGLFYLVALVHGLHVLVGTGVCGWFFVRAMRGASAASLAAPLEDVSFYTSFVALLRIAVFTLFYLV